MRPKPWLMLQHWRCLALVLTSTEAPFPAPVFSYKHTNANLLGPLLPALPANLRLHGVVEELVVACAAACGAGQACPALPPVETRPEWKLPKAVALGPGWPAPHPRTGHPQDSGAE